jgi:hypothetical protein
MLGVSKIVSKSSMLHAFSPQLLIEQLSISYAPTCVNIPITRFLIQDVLCVILCINFGLLKLISLITCSCSFLVADGIIVCLTCRLHTPWRDLLRSRCLMPMSSPIDKRTRVLMTSFCTESN